MSAKAAPSAAPDHAVRAWVDMRWLFIEFPSIHGPCILRYPRSAKGFAEAMTILQGRHANEGHGEVYHTPQPTLSKRDAELAKDLLKIVGIR